MKGTYVLLMKLQNDSTFRIGKRGEQTFVNGYYLYVGSALNGLDQRIQRHLRKKKKMHWHIDYLLQHAEIIAVLYKESTTREECTIAETLRNKLNIIPGFGCSDCSCTSHLFTGSHKEILHFLESLHRDAYSLEGKS